MNRDRIDPNLFQMALSGQPLPEPPPATTVTPKPESLQGKLEQLTHKALAKASEVLDLPVDPENGASLRAQMAATQLVVTTQTRVEETKFRAAHEEGTLNKLLEIIAREEVRLGRVNKIS